MVQHGTAVPPGGSLLRYCASRSSPASCRQAARCRRSWRWRTRHRDGTCARRGCPRKKGSSRPRPATAPSSRPASRYPPAKSSRILTCCCGPPRLLLAGPRCRPASVAGPVSRVLAVASGAMPPPPWVGLEGSAGWGVRGKPERGTLGLGEGKGAPLRFPPPGNEATRRGAQCPHEQTGWWVGGVRASGAACAAGLVRARARLSRWSISFAALLASVFWGKRWVWSRNW